MGIDELADQDVAATNPRAVDSAQAKVTDRLHATAPLAGSAPWLAVIQRVSAQAETEDLRLIALILNRTHRFVG